MNRDEFLERVARQLLWQEHETAAWTIDAGGQRLGEPDFSHRCSVKQAVFLPPISLTSELTEWPYWRWKVTVRSDGVKYKAMGFSYSMENGKRACKIAVLTLASGVLSNHPS